MTPKPCKIIELHAQNVKRLSAIHIRPNGESVVIGGDNNEGKSSVLDSILYALGGERAICEQPLRRGQKKAEITVDLGEYIVTRKFGETGTTQLIVKAANGSVLASPQKILDGLVGKLTFDPLAFMNMDAKTQFETLAKLADIDFAPLNAEYQSLYDQRTEANREVQRLAAQLQGKTETPGLPAEEQLVEELMAQLDAVQKHNAGIAAATDAAWRAQESCDRAHHALLEQDRVVKQIEETLQQARRRFDELKTQYGSLQSAAMIASANAKKLLAENQQQDEQPIKDAISAVGQVNAKIRANRELKAIRAQHRQAAEHWQNLDLQCAATLERKKQLVTEAKFPLEGLSVTDDCVEFDGLPLKQASTSQQIRVSTAIGAALNPNLRTMFIREGSLLDLKTLDAIHELAYLHDIQLFIERVSKGDEVSVIIEDGTVATDRLSPKP